MKKLLIVSLFGLSSAMGSVISSSVLAADHAPKAQAWTQIEWNKTASEMPQGDAARGEVLHRDGLCLSCHGMNGVAPSRNAPSLAAQQAEYTYKTLLDYQSGLRNEHDGKATLMHVATQPMSKQDMADLAMYYAQQATPNRAIVLDTSVDASTVRLVKKGDVSRMIVPCASCHGAHGEGRGITPALAGQTRDYFVRTMQAYKDKRRTNDIHEGMAQFTYQLTDSEIDALADYYATLNQTSSQSASQGVKK